MVDSIVVIGGTGNVGRGIVAAALQRGWAVTVVDQDDSRFPALADEQRPARTVVGSVAEDGKAADLASRLDLPSVDAVVVAVNIPWTPTPGLSATWEQVHAHLEPYLRLHFNAATSLVPKLRPGAVFLGIGGGMADIPASGMSAVSMAQAAQRMLYRHVEREARKSEVLVREVMIRAMVHGYGQPGEPGPGMLGSDVIGHQVCAAIDNARQSDVVVVLEAPA